MTNDFTTEWDEKYWKEYCNTHPGDSGVGGNDPQDPVCDFACEPQEILKYIHSRDLALEAEVRKEERTEVNKAVMELYKIIGRNHENKELVNMASMAVKHYEDENRSRYIHNLEEENARLIKEREYAKDYIEAECTWVKQDVADENDGYYEVRPSDLLALLNS